MDTENKNITTEDLAEDTTISPEAKDELKGAVEETLSKLRRQSMRLGCQVICKTILDKIYAFESANGKKSANDYKRLVKDIKQFCEIGLSRKVNIDGETEIIQNAETETVQN